MKRTTGCLTPFLWTAGIIAFLLFGLAGASGVFISVPALFLLLHLIRKAFAEATETKASSYNDVMDSIGTISEKNLTKLLLSDACKQMGAGQKLEAKEALKRRRIYVIAYLALMCLVINCLYYHQIAVILCGLLTILAEILYQAASTDRMLFKLAQKFPNTHFHQLVREHTYSETETPRCKQLRRYGIIGLIAVLLVFGLFHSKEKWAFHETSEGVTVDAYWPAITLLDYDVQIPETLGGKPVTAIGERAFAHCEALKAVTMPNTVNYVGKSAFEACSNLNAITLSDGLVKIDSYAFKDCSSLEQIQLPQGLQILNGEAFKFCSDLKEIVIPSGVTEIRGNTFENCYDLEKVVLHDGIVDIHAYAFRKCTSLRYIDLPAKITEIHAYTFEECTALRKIQIPYGVTRIGAHAFYGCSALEFVDIAPSVEEIGSSAFRLCKSLKQIEIPKDCMVNERAFKESPTELHISIYTQSDWEKVLKEMENTKLEDAYCVYKKDLGTDQIWIEGKTLELANHRYYAQQLNDAYALTKLESDEALLELLLRAKTAGAQNVSIALYTRVGTDLAGKPQFVYINYDIDTLIGLCRGEEPIA